MKDEVQRQGNYNFGYHGQKLGLSLEYIQRGAGTAQVINDYGRQLSRGVQRRDVTAVIPSGQIVDNIRTRNGDNDANDQEAMRRGFNAALRSR